jgi:hypothetical protein
MIISGKYELFFLLAHKQFAWRLLHSAGELTRWLRVSRGPYVVNPDDCGKIVTDGGNASAGGRGIVTILVLVV